MEYALLIKVGMILKGITWAGYGVAVSYMGGTVGKYIQDYRNAIAKEKEVR